MLALKETPYCSALYVVLPDGVMAYVNRARYISHVGLSCKIFCSLVVAVEIGWRRSGLVSMKQGGTDEFECRVASG